MKIIVLAMGNDIRWRRGGEGRGRETLKGNISD